MIDTPYTRSAAQPPSDEDVHLAQLLETIILRDEIGLSQLYDETVGQVYGLVSRMISHAPDVEEVVCDVYTQIWETAHTFRAARGCVMAWILTIARSRALDRLRYRARRPDSNHHPVDQSILIEEMPDCVNSTEAFLEAFKENSKIREVLAQLAFTPRQIIALAYFRGLSHKDIADTLNLPLGTVKSTLRKTLSQLRHTYALSDQQAETVAQPLASRTSTQTHSSEFDLP